jgi:hypothetical protein
MGLEYLFSVVLLLLPSGSYTIRKPSDSPLAISDRCSRAERRWPTVGRPFPATPSPDAAHLESRRPAVETGSAPHSSRSAGRWHGDIRSAPDAVLSTSDYGARHGSTRPAIESLSLHPVWPSPAAAVSALTKFSRRLAQVAWASCTRRATRASIARPDHDPPDSLSGDPQSRGRFGREARIISGRDRRHATIDATAQRSASKRNPGRRSEGQRLLGD